MTTEGTDEPAADCLPPFPSIGSHIPTVCGETVIYTAITPCVFLKGQAVYFCLSICKADFDLNPQHSCLARGYFSSFR